MRRETDKRQTERRQKDGGSERDRERESESGDLLRKLGGEKKREIDNK